MAPAHIYPGQGSQSVGMGRDLAFASAPARAIWEAADAALGEPISRLAWEGPSEDLDRTVNAQPALLAASIAAKAAVDAAAVEGDDALAAPPRFAAGHSMGQYSAMVAAGVIELGDALRLVRERGRLMQASAADGAMAAIIGLDDEAVGSLVDDASHTGIVTVANRNAPGQVVISGERAAVEAAAAAAKPAGAKRAIVLPVSVAAHSPLMADAAEGMRRALADVTFSDPTTTLLANADASELTTGSACRDELIDHLTRGVDWVAAVEHMAGAGVDTFIEVGPGKVLTGLVRRIATGSLRIAIDDITTPDGLVSPSAAAA